MTVSQLSSVSTHKSSDFLPFRFLRLGRFDGMPPSFSSVDSRCDLWLLTCACGVLLEAEILFLSSVDIV